MSEVGHISEPEGGFLRNRYRGCDHTHTPLPTNCSGHQGFLSSWGTLSKLQVSHHRCLSAVPQVLRKVWGLEEEVQAGRAWFCPLGSHLRKVTFLISAPACSICMGWLILKAPPTTQHKEEGVIAIGDWCTDSNH